MKAFKFIMIFLLFVLVGSSAYANDFFSDPSPLTLTGTGLTTLMVAGLASLVKEKCTIPASELAALKQKYGAIQILSVVIAPPVRDAEGNILDLGEVYYFVVRRPDASHIRMLMKYAKDGDTEKYIDVAVKNLIVGGDLEKLETDGLVYMGVTEQLEKILKPYESFLQDA